MRAYKITANVADPRGFGDQIKVSAVYLYLEQGGKFRLFDYKKFDLKLLELAYVVYKLKGKEEAEEMEAEFYATLIAQEYTVFDVGEVEQIEC